MKTTRTATAIRRVLLVVQSSGIGGMEAHVIDLAGEYVRRGLAVLVVVPEGAPFDSIADRVNQSGAEVARINTDQSRGRINQAGGLRRFLRAANAWRPDVIHIHTGRAVGGMALLTTARALTRATVLFSEHQVPDLKPSLRARVAQYAMDRLAHRVVAVSRTNADLRKRRLGGIPSKAASVLNGVPVPRVDAGERAANRASVRRAHGIDECTTVIGCVVRLSGDKGLDDLIDAFALVRREHPAKLLLVGDGPLRESLGAQAERLGVASDVIFAGHQHDPAPYFDALDVFALAVPAGSMSIALLEAMARGVAPVITFWGPEEAVIDGETGLAAPPNDPAGLAAVLNRLIADGALRMRLGAAAREHVKQHFSVERVAEDMLELYGTARAGSVPERLRADAPANPRPGTR